MLKNNFVSIKPLHVSVFFHAVLCAVTIPPANLQHKKNKLQKKKKTGQKRTTANKKNTEYKKDNIHIPQPSDKKCNQSV
jgi:cell division protein FtsL